MLFILQLVFCSIPFGYVLWYCLVYLFESIIQFPEKKVKNPKFDIPIFKQIPKLNVPETNINNISDFEKGILGPEYKEKIEYNNFLRKGLEDSFKFLEKSGLLNCENEKEEEITKNSLKKKNLEFIKQMTFDEQDQNRNQNIKILNMGLLEALSNENVIYSVRPEGFSDLQLLGNPPKGETVLTLTFKENIEGKDFNDFISDPLSVKRFEISVRERLSKALNIPIEEIVVYQIQKGSIQLIAILPNQLYSNMTQTDKDEQQKNFDNLVRLREKVEADFTANMHDLYISTSAKNVRLTQKFNLKPSDFDSRGDISFSGQELVRGGRKYIQPKQGWVRYGLRVKGIYEDDDWLKMDGTTGEWAVGFHGTSAIDTIAKTNIILAGGANAYGGKMSTDGRQIPAGSYKAVYFAWDVENCYKQNIAINGKHYELAFQCRVNPEYLYDIDGRWFVADASRWVRPYGIVMKQV